MPNKELDTITTPNFNAEIKDAVAKKHAQATTSAELAGVISDETGSGSLVFGTSPTLITPLLDVPSQTYGNDTQTMLLHTKDLIVDYVKEGCLPATSANLTSDISAGIAYSQGRRIVKVATSKTYTASKDTYVDLKGDGTYIFSEVALGAAAPAIAADSIRLAKVITDADNITGVTDLRELKIITIPKVKLDSPDIITPTISASRARAYLNTTQTVATGTWTKIKLDTKNYDNLGEFDSTTNYRFKATTAGYYIVTAGLTVDDMAADKRVLVGIYRNGAGVAQAGVHAAYVEDIAPFVCDIVYLAANDYVELMVFQGSGANKNIYAGTSATFMAIHRLS